MVLSPQSPRCSPQGQTREGMKAAQSVGSGGTDFGVPVQEQLSRGAGMSGQGTEPGCSSLK